MKLSDWLRVNEISRAEFARRVGVSPARVTQLCSGVDRPRLTLAKAIERDTAGAVGLADWPDAVPREVA